MIFHLPEVLDSAHDLRQWLAIMTAGHVPGCSCHRCGLLESLRRWDDCERGRGNCTMCQQLAESLALVEAVNRAKEEEPCF